VVYAASECTQAAVAEAANVTPATIRNARAALSE
jgi:transcription initiation factor TFIIIB Brf1 subunit/transcription initiation factor TFIIB